jgi:probable rRNA maturation factor
MLKKRQHSSHRSLPSQHPHRFDLHRMHRLIAAMLLLRARALQRAASVRAAPVRPASIASVRPAMVRHASTREGTVLIRNTQRTHAVDVDRLEKLTRHLLETLNCGAFDVGLWLTTDATVRKLNTQFRGVRRSTDILSFPFHDELSPGTAPTEVDVDDEDELNLGDMVVSVAYVARKASKAGSRNEGPGVAHAMEHLTAIDDRIQLLVIHGLCHLLNYDHETEDEFAEMAVVEDRLLRVRERWLTDNT